MASKSKSCSRGRKEIIVAGLLFFWIVAIPEGAWGKQIVLKVIGPKGEALAGTIIYQDYSADRDRQWGKEYVCDENGLVYLPEDEVFQRERQRVVLYGLYEDRLAGFVDVNVGDLNKELTVKLTPACRVFGKIKSTDLANLGQKVDWTYVNVSCEDRHRLFCSSEKGEFEVLLPSGKYKLDVGGTRLYSKQEEVKVKAGQKELEINFDLPADRLAHLIGKEAPELQQIKGWINSEPIKLADLRGKVVLLDFWGTWCGPCVGAIPELINLHEKYHDKGLVIIGIHDDSMKSVEELEEEIKKLSKKHWNGRKIPFVVALDGGGECKIEGTRLTDRGATTAAYGIQGWPTVVLIDKEGKVVENYGGTWDIKVLEKSLSAGIDNKPSWVLTILRALWGKQTVLKVVGPKGEALSGAKIYQDYSVKPDGQQRGKEYVCDKNGLVYLPKDEVPQLLLDVWVLMYGLYEDRLAGFVVVEASDLGKEVELKLEPACRVHGRIKSTELTNLGQKVNWTNVTVSCGDRQLLSYLSGQGKFEFLLPNGKYRLYADGWRLYGEEEQVEIAAGQKKLEINFDLPVQRLVHLIGKEAPELQQIKGWINSEPIKLADFRGKVVLLDFWTRGCDPSVMSALIDLHEKYHNKGLVIIGIYEGLVKELEKEIRKIPFAVALDCSGEYKIKGTKLTTSGATTAAYGIRSWPTLVLIDKEGKVVMQYYPSSHKDTEVLEKLLATGVDNRP